ncbi:Magnesium transporter MgtE [bacterium HR33]|nr:Magnesium transporter MgtE [bacterium HR33]
MKDELALASRFVADHPEQAAEVLERLSFSEAAAVLAQLPPRDASRVVARVSASLAVDCLRPLESSKAGEILAELPLELAARLLRRAPDELRESWLEGMPRERSELLRRKLRYPQGTAGALADPLVLALPEDMSVSEAQKQLRRSPDRAYYYLYVVDRDQRLVGALDIRELMLADGKRRLSEVMRSEVVRVPAHADIRSILMHPAWKDLDAIPVVDSGGVFLGIVRHRTMRQMAGSPAPEEASPLVAALVNLGELYWSGMSAFLAGVKVPVKGFSAGEEETGHGQG